jgi:hypothetical protein
MNCKNCYHKDVCNGRIYAEDSENNLKVGDVVYILGRYTPDGDTKNVFRFRFHKNAVDCNNRERDRQHILYSNL